MCRRRIREARTPRLQDLPPGSHPFPTRYVQRTSSLMFNIAGYSRQLVNDFLVEGGKIERVEFHAPSELSQLTQKVNATGYGARALWKDESVVPVRGQITLARRDGIVVQQGLSDMEGYNDTNEVPDRAAGESSVQLAAQLFGRMGKAG